MSSVTVEDVQSRLPQILEQLQPGEEVTVTDHGQPVAQVKRVAGTPGRAPRQPGSAVGQLVVLEEDDEHLVDFAEYME